jgi:FAD/FMN-containing dehydrogenase/Fe-S oxidoreductase
MFKELRDKIAGDLFDDDLRRILLSTDGSIFQKLPASVVYPKNSDDIVKTVLFANQNQLSIHPRGAGSGLCGSAIGDGIVVDFTRYMNRLVRIDIENQWFECEPGFRFGELEAALEGEGLFFPPDPSSGEYATFGGMYATNASGSHSVKYGNVSDYILDAEIVLGNGRVIWLSEIQAAEKADLPENLQDLMQLYLDNADKIEASYPEISSNVAGYNLRGLVQNGRLHLGHLFAGAEGTLGIVTRLKFRLLEKPSNDALVVAFFDDIITSARAVQQILPLGPSGIEIMDKSLLNLARENDITLRDKIPAGIDNLLLIEFDSTTPDECEAVADRVRDLLESEKLTQNIHLALSATDKKKFWAVRKAAVPVLYKLKGQKKVLALIEDAAVPTDRLVDYFDGIHGILGRARVEFVIFGHIAKGLLHTRPLLNLKDPHDIGLLKTLADELFELVHSLGGSVSGEHGDGRIRSAYVKRQYPKIYDLFLKTKRLLDENSVLNPEIKTVHIPDQVQKNLRYGADYHGLDLSEKLLNWQESFPEEAEKCHGCAKCTTITTATRMCPVYKLTRDESATPRAKANVLRALISGAINSQYVYDAAFKGVMDRCFSCGSCYSECPSNVNIPKMVIEAKSQYLKRFGPSMGDRVVANVEVAGRGTHKFSMAVNPFMNVKAFRKAGELFTGISSQRDFTPFAFRSIFDRVGPIEGDGAVKVLYFAGCYASYIRPEIGESAIKVMNRAGFTVYTPPQHCCGLPMLTKGMVKQARGKVMENIRKWRHLLDQVEHIVVTCSSCGLSLTHEWSNVLSRKEAAGIQQKVVHISTLVGESIAGICIKNRNEKIAYHLPCHLKVQPGAESSINMLAGIPGVEVKDLKSHCCGMGGSWGLLAKNFDLSKKIGKDMLQKINVSGCTAAVTDCPTCRMQMEQFCDLPVYHPIEIVAHSI